MAWQKRHTIWIKIISVAVVCLFTINNISSANPDLFTAKNNTCLQVQSAFNPIVSQKITHEMMLKFYTKGIVESLAKQEDFKLRLTLPALDGQFIVLDFENKEYDEKAEKWTIPCSVVDKAGEPISKYNAVVDATNKSVSLEEIKEKRFRLRFPKKDPDDPEIGIEIRGFDEYSVKRFMSYVRFILSDATILKRLRSSGTLHDYDLSNLKKVIIYNPDYEDHKAKGGKIGLLKKKDELWLPVKDANNVYTEIARSLWKVIRPQPLRPEIIEWDEETRRLLEEHDPGMIERMKRCLEWDIKNMDPDYLFAGRSMWLKLQKPIKVNGTIFRYVKVKGITYRGVLPPSSERFARVTPGSIGVDEKGRIVSGKHVSIMGTLTSEAAKNEFDVMANALEDDVSRALRIARGVYPHIELEGHEAGFVAMLMPEAPEITLEQMVFDNLSKVKEEAKRLKDREKADASSEITEKSITEFVEHVKEFIINHGRQVRKGNDKGYFFKYPHHNNCVLFTGSGTKEYRMKDYDPVEIIDRTENPQRMIACRYVDIVQAVHHYKDMLKIYSSLETVLKAVGIDPARVFLEGYFHDRRDDPRGEILYAALNADDPYRPYMSKPVAEADHPAVKLIKDVEYGSRPDLLKKRVMEETGASGIAEFKVPPDVEGSWGLVKDVIAAIRSGKLISLRFDDFAGIDDAYKKIRRQLEFLAGDLSKKFSSKDTRDIVFPIKELLKNALEHGNKFDLSLPVFIYIRLDGNGKAERLDVFDAAKPGEADKRMVAAVNGDQANIRSQGIKLIEGEWRYEKKSIEDGRKGAIGARATVFLKDRKKVSAPAGKREWEDIPDKEKVAFFETEIDEMKASIFAEKEVPSQLDFIILQAASLSRSKEGLGRLLGAIRTFTSNIYEKAETGISYIAIQDVFPAAINVIATEEGFTKTLESMERLVITVSSRVFGGESALKRGMPAAIDAVRTEKELIVALEAADSLCEEGIDPEIFLRCGVPAAKLISRMTLEYDEPEEVFPKAIEVIKKFLIDLQAVRGELEVERFLDEGLIYAAEAAKSVDRLEIVLQRLLKMIPQTNAPHSVNPAHYFYLRYSAPAAIKASKSKRDLPDALEAAIEFQTALFAEQRAFNVESVGTALQETAGAVGSVGEFRKALELAPTIGILSFTDILGFYIPAVTSKERTKDEMQRMISKLRMLERYIYVPVKINTRKYEETSGKSINTISREPLEREVQAGRIKRIGKRYYFPMKNSLSDFFGSVHNRAHSHSLCLPAIVTVVYKGTQASTATNLRGVLVGMRRGSGAHLLHGGLPKSESSIEVDVILREAFERLEKAGNPAVALAVQHGARIDMIRRPVVEADVLAIPVIVADEGKKGAKKLPRAIKVPKELEMPPQVKLIPTEDYLNFIGISKRKHPEEREPVIYVYDVPCNTRMSELYGKRDLEPFFEYYGYKVDYDEDGNVRKATKDGQVVPYEEMAQEVLKGAAARYGLFLYILHNEFNGCTFNNYGGVFNIPHNHSPLTLFDYDTFRLERRLPKKERKEAFRKDIEEAKGVIETLARTLDVSSASAVEIFKQVLDGGKEKEREKAKPSPAKQKRQKHYRSGDEALEALKGEIEPSFGGEEGDFDDFISRLSKYKQFIRVLANSELIGMDTLKAAFLKKSTVSIISENPWEFLRTIEIFSGAKMRVQRSLNVLKGTSMDHEALRKMFVFSPYHFIILCSILDEYNGPLEEILDYFDDSGHIDLRWFLKGKGVRLVLKAVREYDLDAIEGLVKMLGLEADNFIIGCYGPDVFEKVQRRFPRYYCADVHSIGHDPGFVWVNFSESYDYFERGVAYISYRVCEIDKFEKEDIPTAGLLAGLHLALKAAELSTPPEKDSSAFFAMPLFLGEQTLDFSWATFAIVAGGLLLLYFAYRAYRAWTAEKQTETKKYRHKLVDEGIFWRMVASRRKIPLNELDEWKRQNPDQVKILEKQLEAVLKNNDFYSQLYENWSTTMGIVDPSDERFKALYDDTREVFDRVLKAKGYECDDFNLLILDDGYEYPRGFVLPYSNTVCINMKFIRVVVDSGGTVDGFAHVLAHELAHVDQFVDDIFEGKELEFPRDVGSWGAMQRLQGRHADEYQADIESLSTMDKAGYTVRGALDMMRAFCERERGRRSTLQMVLTMLSHPLTDERIRKLEKQVNGLHWPSYYNDLTEFSDEFKRVVNLKTRNQEFKEWVHPKYPHHNDFKLQGIDTAMELIRRSDSPEKLFLALDLLIMYVFPTEEKSPEECPLSHDEEAQRRIRSAFEEQVLLVAGEDRSMADLFRIFFELSTMKSYPNSEEMQSIVERIGLDNVLSAFKSRLPYEIDPRLKTFFQDIMNKFLQSIIPYALKEKMTDMVRQNPERTKDVITAIKGLDKWKKQMAVMNAVSSDSFVEIEGPNTIQLAQQAIMGDILSEPEIINDLTPEGVKELLSFIDSITTYNRGLYQHDYSVRAVFDLLTRADPEISALTWKWMCEDEGKKSELKDILWTTVFSYISEARTREFPESAACMFAAWFGDISRETIFERFGQAEYLFKRSSVEIWDNFLPLIGLVNEGETPLFPATPEEQIDVIEWLFERTDLYDRNYYDHTGSRERARNVFKKFKKIPISLIEERLARRDIQLDASVHPDVKLLIYMYSKDAIIDERMLRDIVLREDLDEGDILTLYEYVRGFEPSLKIKLYEHIKGAPIGDYIARHKLKEKHELWNSNIFPLQVQVFSIVTTGSKAPTRELNSGWPGFDSPVLEIFFPKDETISDVSRQRDLQYGSRSVDVTRFNRSRYVEEDEARGFVSIIRNSQKSFDEILNDLTRIVPPSPYRNFVLYCLLVEKKLRDEWGVGIEDDAIYDAVGISRMVASLDETRKRQFLELLTQRIVPLLSKDEKIEKLNLGVMTNAAYKSTTEDARIAMNSIITAHNGEFASYPDLYRAEPGGLLAQFDLMVPALAAGILPEILDGPEETENKIDLIFGLFTRPSNTRDNYLRGVLEKGEPSIRDIDKALPLFYNPHIREEFALMALEMEREEFPARFETLEGEIGRATHYFPYFCFNRDDILFNVQSRALTPEDEKLINDLLFQHPDNLRKKTQSQFTFYEDAVREAIKAMEPADKKDYLLWFMGLRDAKSYNMIYFEYEMRVKLDSLRDRFSGMQSEHYKDIGASEFDDFFVSFLYGEKGILTDDNASREFLDTLFDAVLPGESGSIFKAIYDSVFRKRDTDTTTDELRREEVVLAMIKELSQLSREEDLSGEEKEAAVIRIFLESLGVVGVKLGQFLASSDLIEEGPVKNALKELKDSAKPLNKGVVFDAIKKFFGGFYKKFKSLGEEVGSASIKSVYKALLRNGRKAVVKVKRPEAQKRIESDLAFFRRALGDIRDDLAHQNISLPDNMIERIEEMINEEMDFNREAENQKRLARNLRTRFHPWRGLKRFIKALVMYFTGKWNYLPQSGSYRFKVPRAIDAGNNSIMIEEFADGVKLSNMEYIPVDLRRAIANELLRQIFVDGFYHADPHSGNIFLKDDGKTVVFVDLGSCSEINEENQINLRQIISGIREANIDAIVSVIGTFGVVSDELKSEIDSGAIKAEGSDVNKILKLFNILEKHKVKVPKQLLSVFRFFGSAGYLFEESVPETRGPPSVEQEGVPGEPVIEITDSGAVSFADLSGGKYKTILGLRGALGSLLLKHGYSENAEVALDAFFHEIIMNAMKAKGFMRFTDKYGSIESFIARRDMNAEEKYKIVRRYLEEGYKITKLRIWWEVNDQNIKLAVSNDSVPDQYHLARIKESYESSPNIIPLIEEGRFYGDAAATRAFSCMGRGIAITKETAEKTGGSLTYSIENGWTTFSMHVPGPPGLSDKRHPLTGRTILGVLLAGLLTPRLVQAAETGVQLVQGTGVSWVVVPLIIVGVIVFSFLGMMSMRMGGPRLQMGMVGQLETKLKMALKHLMKIIIRIEKEDPVPPEAKVGLEGLKEADRILKEHGAVGIIIGSTAVSLYNRRKKNKDLKEHSDIDVVVLTPASQLKKPFEKFEGGIDWWLPEDLPKNLKIKDAHNREVKRIFVNGNSVFLRAGVELDTKLAEVDLPEPGLHLPSRDFAIDLTECVAMALIDPEHEVDTATRAYFRNKIDRDVVRKTMSPVWRKNFAGKVLHKALLEVIEFDLDTITAINNSTPYVDIEGREKTPKADEQVPQVTIPPPPEELKVEVFRQNLRYFLRDVFTSEWVDIILASAESYVITGKEKGQGFISSTYFKKKAGMTLRFVEDPNHGIVGIVEDKGEVIDHITVNYHIGDNLNRGIAKDRTLGWADIKRWQLGEEWIKPREDGTSYVVSKLDKSGRASKTSHYIGKKLAKKGEDVFVLGTLVDVPNFGVILVWHKYDPKTGSIIGQPLKAFAVKEVEVVHGVFRKTILKEFDITKEILDNQAILSAIQQAISKMPCVKSFHTGLIGKWQIASEIKFVPDSEGSSTGVLVFQAMDITHPGGKPIEIKMRVKRVSPDIFDNFYETPHEEINEQLDKFIDSDFKGEAFLIEPNDYGIEGIGARNLVAVLKPFGGTNKKDKTSSRSKDEHENKIASKMAKLHELAHALIDKQIRESREGRSVLLEYIISKLVYEGKIGEGAIEEYLKEKMKRYGIPDDDKAGRKWRDAWRAHYALRLYQKQYLMEEDKILRDRMIRPFSPQGKYPPEFPPDKIRFKDPTSEEFRGELPIEMEIRKVERNGPLMKPRDKRLEYNLNAGVLALAGRRLLFNRIAINIPGKKNVLRKSWIGLLLHDKSDPKEGEECDEERDKKREIKELDEKMLMPEDESLCSQLSDVGSKEYLDAQYNYLHATGDDVEHWQSVMSKIERDSEIIALEDARAIEREIWEEVNGKMEKNRYVYVFLTAVRRDGQYFSAVTKHDSHKFLKNVQLLEKGKSAEVNWEWKPLKKLITDMPGNIKNFVPFGNPANGKWYALFRPSMNHNSQMWIAEIDSSGDMYGTWKTVGPYKLTALPPFHWMGPSAYVANVPTEEFIELNGFDLTLVHAAAMDGEDKYYDLRLLLTDNKDPRKKFISEPILKPEKGQPYELENEHDLWIPGVIYSCGAILSGWRPDREKGGYILTIDVYYSGSDTAILWATVEVVVREKKDEEKRRELVEATKELTEGTRGEAPAKEPPVKKPPVEEPSVKESPLEEALAASPGDRESARFPEDEVTVSGDRVLISRKGAYYSFEISPFKRMSDGRKGIILNQVGISRAKGTPPDMLIYSVPIEGDEDRHGLKGILISEDLQEKGLLRPLLNMFFTMYPDVKRIHPGFSNPLTLDFLGKEYGFEPEEGSEPSAWYRRTGKDSILRQRHDKKFRICFKDADTRIRFRDMAGIVDQYQYQVEAAGEELEAVDLKGYDPVCLFTGHALRDNEKFEQALASVPINIRKMPDTGEKPEADLKFLLRDVSDPDELAKNLVEMVVSGTLSRTKIDPLKKKIFLTFDRSIDSDEAVNIFRILEDLKGDDNYKKLLNNLEIVIPGSKQTLSEAIDERLKEKGFRKEDAVIFVFAEESAEDELSWARNKDNVQLAYIQRTEEFRKIHYYPLAEIVTITLARYISKGRLSGFTKEELDAINIAEMRSESAAPNSPLIFKLLPNIERYDHDRRMDRYATMRQVIEAA